MTTEKIENLVLAYQRQDKERTQIAKCIYTLLTAEKNFAYLSFVGATVDTLCVRKGEKRRALEKIQQKAERVYRQAFSAIRILDGLSEKKGLDPFYTGLDFSFSEIASWCCELNYALMASGCGWPSPIDVVLPA